MAHENGSKAAVSGGFIGGAAAALRGRLRRGAAMGDADAAEGAVGVATVSTNSGRRRELFR